MEEYFQQLKTLIEQAYQNNNNTPIVLLAHSFGVIYSWYFLSSSPEMFGIDQAWKNQYIRSFFMVGDPITGTVYTLKIDLVGRSLLALLQELLEI